MDTRKPRTRATVWNAAALPGPVTVGRGRRAVRLEVTPLGRDLLVTLTGGQAHAGAVALAGPPGGPAGGGLLVLPPHREGPLARECAEAVAAAADCVCVAAAGIHQDEATPQEIAAIVANARAGIARLAAALRRVPAAQRYCRARLPKPSTP
ncbi:hypothetical protein FJ250_02280 [bacterium]|nr:hypothetical protein [bacterium]